VFHSLYKYPPTPIPLSHLLSYTLSISILSKVFLLVCVRHKFLVMIIVR
ncbi:hypothetical protein LINPERHAP2_LOCUS41839, partial [Linum perenne]